MFETPDGRQVDIGGGQGAVTAELVGVDGSPACRSSRGSRRAKGGALFAEGRGIRVEPSARSLRIMLTALAAIGVGHQEEFAAVGPPYGGLSHRGRRPPLRGLPANGAAASVDRASDQLIHRAARPCRRGSDMGARRARHPQTGSRAWGEDVLPRNRRSCPPPDSL
jgi:hypothetical protein